MLTFRGGEIFDKTTQSGHMSMPMHVDWFSPVTWHVLFPRGVFFQYPPSNDITFVYMVSQSRLFVSPNTTKVAWRMLLRV